MVSRTQAFLVIASIILLATQAAAFQGRHSRYGFVPPPPEDLLTSKAIVSDVFTQRLDHFNPQETRTFAQRYFMNDEFFNKSDPKAPVFLFLGGEGELRSSWVTQGLMYDLGKRFKALLIAIEHRYYGDSHPFTDLSTPNLAWLNTQQALGDYAYFSQFYNNGSYTGRRWYTFGGSYAGGLAAWARMKYPMFFHGALSSSGPVDPVVDYKQYFEVVQDALYFYGGQQCVDDFTVATHQVDTMIKSSPTELAQQLNLCYAPHKFNTKNDMIGLWETISDTFAGIVQYNQDGAATSVRTVCDRLKSAQDKGQTYLSIIRSRFDNSKCQQWDYNSWVVPIADETITRSGNMRQWIYQTCTEYGYYQTTGGATIFPKDKIPLSFFIDLCKDAFSTKFNLDYINRAAAATIVNFGSTDIQASNVIWTNGNIDPWHVLSVLERTSQQPESMTLIMSEGTSHCAILYAERPTDTQSIKDARRQVADIFAGYLAQP